MDSFINFLSEFWDSFSSFMSWVLDGFVVVLKSVFYFIFDGLLTLLSSVISSLDVSYLLSSVTLSWAGLPDNLIYCINAVGFPACLALVSSAIIIRKTLDLIPAAFTRF